MDAPDLPRVTEVLRVVGLGPDLDGVAPEILEAALARGATVHRLLEDLHYGLLTPADVPPDLEGYVAAYLRFAGETKHEAIVSELAVTSTRWRYQGHIDRVGWVHGRRAICDWKTSASVDVAATGYQLAAYRLAYRELHPSEPAETCYAVQLREDGTYRLHEITDAQAEQVFLAALIVYHARSQRR